MKNTYRVWVNEDYQFDLDIENANDLDQLSFQGSTSGRKKEKLHILHQNTSYIAELLGTNFIDRRYAVGINGTTYSVEIETPLDQLIEEMGLSLGNASVEDEIHAPMPGIILEVNVSEGDEVKEGDFLCVLEAMKMENALTAPRNGKIKSVPIKKGDTVDKGKLLIEFHTND